MVMERRALLSCVDFASNEPLSKLLGYHAFSLMDNQTRFALVGSRPRFNSILTTDLPHHQQHISQTIHHAQKRASRLIKATGGS